MREDLSEAEIQAWDDLHEAEQALERARWRVIEATNASTPRRGMRGARSLRLAPVAATGQDPSSQSPVPAA